METKTAKDKTLTMQDASTQQNAPAKKGRGSIWIVGGVAAVVALIVFVGGAVTSGILSATGRGGLFERPAGDRPAFRMEPAKELPTTAPSVRGVVTQRADKTISVTERGGRPFGENGQANPATGNNALQVEVVVTDGTTIYHDITRLNLNAEAPSGTVQQKLEPGSLDGVSTNSRVTVWGDQNGNQLAARVLVYTDPIAFQQPQ